MAATELGIAQCSVHQIVQCDLRMCPHKVTVMHTYACNYDKEHKLCVSMWLGHEGGALYSMWFCGESHSQQSVGFDLGSGTSTSV